MADLTVISPEANRQRRARFFVRRTGALIFAQLHHHLHRSHVGHETHLAFLALLTRSPNDGVAFAAVFLEQRDTRLDSPTFQVVGALVESFRARHQLYVVSELAAAVLKDFGDSVKRDLQHTRVSPR